MNTIAEIEVSYRPSIVEKLIIKSAEGAYTVKTWKATLLPVKGTYFSFKEDGIF